jgi:hypothetical protein
MSLRSCGRHLRQTCVIAPVVCGAGTPSSRPAFPALLRGRAERRVPDAPMVQAPMPYSAREMRPETSGFTGFIRRSARDEAPACFVLFPAEWSTPGTEDAARRPVGVANSPIRDAPFGIEKPHDLGRRDSVVRQRFDRWFTALLGAAQPPTSAPDAVASPHPAPRIVTIASRPSQWSGTKWIIILLGILSSESDPRKDLGVRQTSWYHT